jgi:hypothetical protein
MDLPVFITSLAGSAAALGVAAWLARTWLGARIKGEVEHLYAQKLEGLKADLAAKHEVAMEKLRTTLTLTSDAAKVRQAAYQHVLAAVSPAVGLAFFAAATSEVEDENGEPDGTTGDDPEIQKQFLAAYERAGEAILSEFLLIGGATSVALLGFLGYADRLVTTLATSERGDPRRVEVVSKLWPMIQSVERALPEFARLPADALFQQADLTSVYIDVGIWAHKAGKMEIVNPGE